MSSRRKSTTPCMLPNIAKQSERSAARVGGVTAASDDSDDSDVLQTEYLASVGGGASAAATTEGGYECKYCSFQTSDLNLFTNHVDSQHPTIVTNTSYVCMECNYATKSYDTLLVHNARVHPGEDSFTRTMVTRNNRTIFQQTVNDLTFDGGFVKAEDEDGGEGQDGGEGRDRGVGLLSQTPIVRRSQRPSSPPPADVIKVESDGEVDEEEEDYDSKEMPVLSPAPVTPQQTPAPTATATATAPRLVSANQSLVVNGSGVQLKGGGGGGVLASGTLAQVLTALQGQTQSSSPQTQLLIPVSSIPTYSPSMDHNLLLISAFNRFPYPSVTEILGLSSQTKFSEEQIKVWFSAQRLKHGVSWTPEEVEEARRKKLNGAVQAPPTIAVIGASLAAANGLQSLFQTCHIVGQPGLVFTQLPANPVTQLPANPVTLTVTPPSTRSPAPDDLSSASCDLSGSGKPKKSKEQLAELKASYGRRPFATESEISRLMQVTKLSKRAIKKWFSDTRYNQRNANAHANANANAREHQAPSLLDAPPSETPPRARSKLLPSAILIDDDTDSSLSGLRSSRSRSPASSPSELRAKARHAFPDFTLQKFKEKTPEQLVELEQSFRTSVHPSEEELSRLRSTTKLTRRELQAWFSERRRLPQGGSGYRGDQVSSEATAPSEPRRAEPGGRRAVKKSPEQLHALKRAFVRSQWPTAAEYDRLSADTGLPRTDIINWFGDTRYSAKNSALRWYYLYHSGKGDEALNGGAKKKPRKRFRGWSRRRRPRRSTQEETTAAAAVKVKPGRWFLKQYYLRHRALSETDLDELVSKSGLSYEQVRDWFRRAQSREEDGLKAFSSDEEEQEEAPEEEEQEEALEEEQEEEEPEEEAQDQEEPGEAAEGADAEMEHQENVQSEEEQSVENMEEEVQPEEEVQTPSATDS